MGLELHTRRRIRAVLFAALDDARRRLQRSYRPVSDSGFGRPARSETDSAFDPRIGARLPQPAPMRQAAPIPVASDRAHKAVERPSPARYERPSVIDMAPEYLRDELRRSNRAANALQRGVSAEHFRLSDDARSFLRARGLIGDRLDGWNLLRVGRLPGIQSEHGQPQPLGGWRERARATLLNARQPAPMQKTVPRAANQTEMPQPRHRSAVGSTQREMLSRRGAGRIVGDRTKLALLEKVRRIGAEAPTFGRDLILRHDLLSSLGGKSLELPEPSQQDVLKRLEFLAAIRAGADPGDLVIPFSEA